ncbi:hypothetical protein B0H11DRAFT_2194442 [Mycena galericulata]|nr:hypothetical protein B0H11DRAFT_2194442 [Mycena galericulata]
MVQGIAPKRHLLRGVNAVVCLNSLNEGEFQSRKARGKFGHTGNLHSFQSAYNPYERDGGVGRAVKAEKERRAREGLRLKGGLEVEEFREYCKDGRAQTSAERGREGQIRTDLPMKEREQATTTTRSQDSGQVHQCFGQRTWVFGEKDLGAKRRRERGDNAEGDGGRKER